MKKILLLLTICFSITLSAQLQVASDINQGNAGSSLEDFFEFKGQLFFSALTTEPFTNNDIRKIWKTDGTESGTIQIDALPEEHYFPSDNIVYFTNDNNQVYKTDGTETNTTKIHDGNSYFDPLGSFKDYFYYMEVSSATEIGLFKTNGEETILLKSFPGEENARSGIFNDNNAVFKFNENKFIALIETKTDGVNAYISDGTVDGTKILHDTSKGVLSKSPLEFHNLDNNTTVYTDKNKRIWATDGTLEGTKLIKTLSGSNSRKIHSLTTFNNKIYFGFLFTDDFWETDGTESGTKSLFSNINSDGNVQGIVKRDNDLVIFTQRGIHLFDGTTTTKVSTPDITNINYFNFKKINDKIYFTANYKDQGNRIWITDGTESGTYSLDPIWPDSNVPTHIMYSVNGKFIFSSGSHLGGYNIGELWVSDGTNAGTKLLKDINLSGNLNSTPKFQTELNGKIYFSADDNIHGRELFVFDGTSTTLVKNINPGFQSSTPHDFYVLNDKIIFKATTLNEGIELWITDGTSEGTQILKDINTNGSGFQDDNRSYVRLGNFKLFKDEYYFYANNGINGMELWKTDGTEAGTIMIKDINSGANSSYRPALDSRPRFVEHNDALYFIVSSSGSDNNLSSFRMWKTDGTEAGTTLVSEVNSAVKNGTLKPLNYFSFNEHFYFNGRDPSSNKFELFRTDPTSGTVKISDIGNVTNFYPLKEKIFFVFNDNNGAGSELWAIEKDDTFTLYKDIIDGSHSSTPTNIFEFNDYLYFNIRNESFESELYRVSDTTEPEKLLSKENLDTSIRFEGNFEFIPHNDRLYINTSQYNSSNFTTSYKMYRFSNTASSGSTIFEINNKVPYQNLAGAFNAHSTILNNKIYFTGDIESKGEELLSLDFGTLSLNDIYKESKSNFTFNLYPNPTQNKLNINTDSTIKKGIIYNILGKEIERFSTNTINVSNYQTGLYILKIEDKYGNVSSKKWIKN